MGIADNWAQVVSTLLPLAAGVWGYFRLIGKRDQAHEVHSAIVNTKLESIEKTLEKQFGGNSGGIREAINSMQGKVDKIEDRVNSMSAELANVSGRFEQHIEEN